MQIKEKIFSLGSIKYRLPNVPETMRMLGYLSQDDNSKMPETAKGRNMAFMASMIENMRHLIVEVTAELDGQTISSFDEALEHTPFMAPLSEIAAEVLQHISTRGAKDAERKNS